MELHACSFGSLEKGRKKKDMHKVPYNDLSLIKT
jgi:hypothetical protein